MGARQRAQRRANGGAKAAKNSLKGSPISQKRGNSSIPVPNLDSVARGNALLGWQSFALSSSPGNRHGLSMSQEARNTERHVFGWGSTKLRGNAITFVSAGHLHQDELQKPAQEDSPERETSGPTSLEPVVEPGSPITALPAPSTKTVDAKEDHEVLLQETIPQIRLKCEDDTANPQPPAITQRQRSLSAASSDSEKIVFAGRSNISQLTSQVPSRNGSKSRHEQHESFRDRTGATALNEPETTALDEPEVASKSILTKMSRKSHLSYVEASSSARRSTPGRQVRRGRRRLPNFSDEEEALMQDYIANMAVDDDSDIPEHLTAKPVRKNETLRFYSGGGEENAKVQIKKLGVAGSSNPNNKIELDQAMDWNSDDLEIFDNVSTSDEDVAEVAQVLRQRERQSGLQYLVTAKGRTIEDAKWILQTRLVSESAIDEVRIFDEIQAMETIGDSSFDEGDMSDSEDEEALDDLIGQIESEDDENARILAHTARMTDEQIARRLAKQEELGLGADEIMLFGDDINDHGYRKSDLHKHDAFDDGDDFIAFSTKKHTSNRTRTKHNKKQRDTFPPAAAFADALDEDPYGGFDIMDFDRPSLRPRKKGRKSDFLYDVELEDEDLREQLVSTWSKDREKKAARKREKEEARMTAAFDVSERNEPAVIKAEIRRFLCQEIDLLKLAPMDPSTRASVHRLAKALGLHSRSEGADGKGKGRYPVLTKTARTPMYTINTIWEVDALMNTRKFFPKNSNSHKTPRPSRAIVVGGRRGGGGVQGATYMNGEVVGASAPEIGADNKGRAMLEKMGWTTGMGIGAEGNKGSLEAIKHVVKTTKAGLG